jgi:hypothetical protein
MPDNERSTGTHLELLMDMELENRQGAGRTIQAQAKIGDFLAGGEGAVFGPRINGIVHWDLYQEQGEFVCGSNLRGSIKTDDGYQISFDSIGNMIRPDLARPTFWFTTASVSFTTDSQLYKWLNNSLAVLQGRYDMGSNRHSYRIFTQVID